MFRVEVKSNMVVAEQNLVSHKSLIPPSGSGSCLTPSARKVLEVLQDGNEYNLKTLTEMTGVCNRTTRFAVNLLRRNAFIVAKFNFRDARQLLYRLKTMEDIAAETHAGPGFPWN
jgi:hypothetical protein